MAEVTSVSHEYTPDANGGGFVMRIAKEGQPTVDGRIFDKDSIQWRNPPIPLMFIRSNDPSGRGGHKSSSAVGTITEIWKETNEEGFSTVFGRGYFSTDDEGQSARTLIKEGVISGVSADVGGAVVEELEAEDTENGVVLHKRIKSGEIVAVTCLPIPAFDDMKVSVTAASGPSGWAPPKAWFENPNLTEPTPITVTADGRVYGHVALWGTCHVGHRDRCITPPRSRNNYQYFNVGQILTAEGEAVSVGRLTAGTNHASLEFGAQPAADHYDHTGWAAAYVHSGEDEHGIWFSGAVSPTATPEQVAVLRAASVSGDWRAISGALEMVGVLAVNSPGFPIPRARAGIVAGAQVSLIASNTADCGCGCGGSDGCAEKETEEELRINMEEEMSEESAVEQEAEESSVEDVEAEESVESPEEEEVTSDEETDSDADDTDESEDFEAELIEWDVVVMFPETV